METVKGLHSLLAKVTTGLAGNDLLAVKYAALSAIETVAHKLRVTLKAEILSCVKGSVLEDALVRVSKLDRAESVTLLTGRTQIVMGHIKCGPTFIDLDLLKGELGVSEKRWDNAVANATKRREPTLTIVVSDKRGS